MHKNGRTILLGEEDLEVRGYLETALQCQGFTVETAESGEEIVASVEGRAEPFAAVVMDAMMPRRNGGDPLKDIRRTHRDLPVIVISGAASPLGAAEAVRNGADFIANPVHPQDIRKALQSLIGDTGTAAKPAAEAAAAPANKQVFFGASPKIRELQNLIDQVGWSEAPVLIQGETGTGKEVFARELHARSPRAKRTMRKLNCVALPSELVESELFGYERGAFTGAFQKKLGSFELADGGTIMLDEIGDMDFKLQSKLLQVLQDHEFQRLGGKESIQVDVRVIAATHRDLESAIADNRFREDLFYRLNVVSLYIPPLRERREDILPLAEFLARKHAPAGAPAVSFPPALRELMLQHSWPGNIRQLENVVRKFLIMGDSRLIERELRGKIGTASAGSPGPVPLEAPAPAAAQRADHTINGAPVPMVAEPEKVSSVFQQADQAKREVEREAILAALKQTNWNRRQAGLLLHIEYKPLLYKMKVLGIKQEGKRPRRRRTAAAA